MSLDHYDSISLSHDHLRDAEALFFAIVRLLDEPADIVHARLLANLGGSACWKAAHDLHEKADQVLEDREGRS